MGLKQTFESRVLDYVRTAPIGEVELVFGLIRGEVQVRRRQAIVVPAPKQVAKIRKPRGPNKAKASKANGALGPASLGAATTTGLFPEPHHGA